MTYTLNKYDESSISLLRKANQYGSIIAKSNLAHLYLEGNGVPQNISEAIRLYKESAMIGNNISQYALAWHYYKGTGIEKDYSKAYTWSIIAELDKNDNVTGWERDYPTNIRFFLDRIITNENKQKAKDLADKLLIEINNNHKKHIEKYLYKRSEYRELVTSDSSNT